MSGHDYLKFLIEKLVTHMNEPSRDKQDLPRKQSLSSDHLFGVIPFAIRTYFTKK